MLHKSRFQLSAVGVKQITMSEIRYSLHHSITERSMTPSMGDLIRETGEILSLIEIQYREEYVAAGGIVDIGLLTWK